ncbi:MAG: hypothetical protein CVV29_12125 [Methanobacteriales archaeon HGW-Methanobacteriales-2]|nr:MAG: hypothetical protein CVV29_12125 [Methanobacteriales archaeon HGW-Methanobacteriales-2]
MNITFLSVNLNKVALVRNTRHLGIPSLMVPIENHPEQMKNATKMERYGIAQVEKMGTLTSQGLSERINSLLKDQDLQKNAASVRNIFSQYKGTEDAASIIRNSVNNGKLLE